MANLRKIADDLSKLSVLEAADLARMLEEKWRDAGIGSAATRLFLDRGRTRTEPLRPDEALFDFYDNSAGAGYSEFRTVVNGWLAEMPAKDRSEMISRMRYGENREFGACLVELSIHAFILGSGYRAKPHPEVPGTTKRPDYAATDEAGLLQGYVEVTTFNPSDSEVSDKNRENPIFDAINTANIPTGSHLGYRLKRAGRSNPALKPLVADVERWARDNVEAAKAKQVHKTFTVADWEIELDLYSGSSNPVGATQAIGATLRGGAIEPHKEIRDALYEKTRRYGMLDQLYLIAVADGKDQLFGKKSVDSALTDAVFGDEIVQFKGNAFHVARAKNGFWHGPNGPRNQHVSGLLLLPETGLWKLREERWQPVLAVNPWAERPLPDALRTIGRFEADEARWTFQEGKWFADIIGLPYPWPAVEAGEDSSSFS
jgi:hypothetical protein